MRVFKKRLFSENTVMLLLGVTISYIKFIDKIKMTLLKIYWKKLYRVLTAITVIAGIIYIFTGKATFTEYISSVNNYFHIDASKIAKENPIVESQFTFIPNSDNFVTTFFKTFFVTIAILFLCFAAFISAILELPIFLFSWGDHPFFCAKQIWNLCWDKIVLHWYWIPGKSLYLGISLVLFSGLFGNESRNNPREIPQIRGNKRQSNRGSR